MKKAGVSIVLSFVIVQLCYSDLPEFAGGSFSSSLQPALTLTSKSALVQISFSGYGYASLSDKLFVGGFGAGFGGQDTVSGYGGIAIGVLLNKGVPAWYFLNLAGVGLLGYRNIAYFGMIDELTINRGILLSDRFLSTLYVGLNLQANLSERAFTKYVSIAPVLGARMDFGDFKQ